MLHAPPFPISTLPCSLSPPSYTCLSPKLSLSRTREQQHLSVAAGETPADIITTSWRSYEVWAAPEVYSMILKAAHDGAQAMMDSPKGHLMRMVSNVMVRVDVVLGAQWDHTGQVLLWPMINEMDWFNSAGMMTNFWKGQAVPSGSEAGEQELPFESEAGEGDSNNDRGMTEVQSSAGFKIAQALYKEILAM